MKMGDRVRLGRVIDFLCSGNLEGVDGVRRQFGIFAVKLNFSSTVLMGAVLVSLLIGCSSADDEAGEGSGVGGTGGSVVSTGAVSGSGAFSSVGGGSGGAGAGVGGSSASGGAGVGGLASGGTASGGDSSGGATSGGANGADPDFMIFLLIGQSNMAGVPQPQAQDQTEHPRVKVLAYNNCGSLGRTYNEWYAAKPPLHGCWEGVGPGDNFGKALADAFPNATIGLVPNAISGVDIDFFRKGVVSSRRNEFQIPPDNHWSGAYEWVIERAKLAQQTGVIRGIIFHQGESDSGSPQWVGKVKGIVSDLRADLGIGNVPFIAGELPYGGCCATYHNPLVNQLPSQIDNAFVVSASGLGIMQDKLHFDLAGQRELGKRYGQKMLDAL